MVPCVILTNRTLGTMDDILVSSEPEWFSNLILIPLCEWPLFQFPSLAHPCSPAVVHLMWNRAHSGTWSRGQCWGMCVPAGTGAAPWHSPLLCWDSGPAVCMETMPAHEPLPWEPAAHCSSSITISAGLCQPGKLKKVILTQSNDVLSSQLPCLKIYLKEELIVPKFFILSLQAVRHSIWIVLKIYSKEKTVIFSEL